jgi:pyruvate kinase
VTKLIERNARRTKVIKSFEGEALTTDYARQAAAEDVDIVRLVYRPKMLSAIGEFVHTARVQPGGDTLPVMLDLSSWPQGAIHGLSQPKEVRFGEKLVLTPGGGNGTIGVRAESWEKLFRADAKVFIGSGNVTLKTLSARSDRIELEVMQGGTIYPDMDVVVPDARHNPERLDVTAAEIKPLTDTGIDYLLVPGQWEPKRLAEFRAALAAEYADGAPWMLVKVDAGEVYERLASLLPHVDGVFVSRREMALTANPALVPMWTKEIIQLCTNQAKVVVTASEMLASMRRNVTPTRAEVSDIANAVLDGTDAVVLSKEVANGRYGDKAVEVMHRIITDIEERTNVTPNWSKEVAEVSTEMDAIAYQAYRTAERIKAKAIVTITKAGNTALKLASFRAPIPVIAVTFSAAVSRRLSIVRGVDSLLLDIDPNLDEVLPVVNERLVRSSWLKAGDPIIFVAITLSSVGRESSNLFTIQVLN